MILNFRSCNRNALQDLLRKEKEENDFMFKNFSNALQDLEDIKNEAIELQPDFKLSKEEVGIATLEEEKRLEFVENKEEEIQKVDAKSDKLKTKDQIEFSDRKIDEEISEIELENDKNDEQAEEIIFAPPNPLHMFAESNVEIERIVMEMEDRASLQYEEFLHKLKFTQKDIEIPLNNGKLPPSLYLNEPIQANPAMQCPTKESFTKYMANQRPIDLSKVQFRVLWSKEKVAKEEEEKRTQKEIAKREKKKKLIKSFGSLLDNNN